MPRLLLILAIALFALASPLVKWLIVRGGDTGIVTGEAISFCNVLFVGNLCAGVVTLLIFRGRLWRDLRTLRHPRAIALMVLNILMAVAIPSLIFTALETATVTDVVLLSRFEAVAYTVFAAVVLKDRVPKRHWIGYGVIIAGIVALIVISGGGMISTGSMYVLLAGLCYGVAAVASKVMLRTVSVPLFVFLRNAVSSIVFFAIAIALYGFEHFTDAFAPDLWLVMTVYALVIVVIAQLAWYRALDSLPAAVVSNWTMATPALAILFACLLLSERPTTSQIVGGLIIVVGMVIVQGGPKRRAGMLENSVAAA